MFYFYYSKNLEVLWKIFLIHLYILLNKYFLVKTYKKQMSYKESKVRLQKLIKFRL